MALSLASGSSYILISTQVNPQGGHFVFLWSSRSLGNCLLPGVLSESSSCQTLPGFRSISSIQEAHWVPPDRGEEGASENMRGMKKEQFSHKSLHHYTPWARNDARSRKKHPDLDSVCLYRQQTLPLYSLKEYF